MADLFLSYSRANRPQAAAIAQAAEAGGRSVWWEGRTGEGESRGAMVQRELDSAAAVVVAWSRSARESLWVRAEANAAFDRGKLVQLNLDGVALPMPFAMVHYLDARIWGGAREQMPWPQVEARLEELSPISGGGRPAEGGGIPFLPGPERALQGFGQYALLGWTAIAVAVLTGIFTVAAARGNISGETLGVVSLVALVLSVGLLAAAAFLFVRISLASRR